MADLFENDLSYAQAQELKRRRRILPEKRKRVVKACQRCRDHKLRCQGTRPCDRCARSNTDCIYPVLSGSNNSDAYVAKLEERQIYLEYMLQRHIPGLTLDTPSLRSLAESYKKEEFGDHASASVEGRVQQKLLNEDEGVRDVLDGRARLIVEKQGQTHYLGESAGWSFIDSIRESITTTPGELDVSARYNTFLEENADEVFEEINVSDPAALLPPRPTMDFLINTFFRHCQTMLLYTHETIFRKKLGHLLHSLGSDQEDTIFLCVLLMVLAVGSQFAELETQSPTPDAGFSYYKAARMLLPHVITACKMSSVQACLLMTSYLQWTRQRDVSYAYMGMAVRMAVSNGMHRRCNVALDPRVVEIRTRLWWSIYTKDRFMNMSMGRPMLFSDNDCDLELPRYLPELDGPNSSPGIDVMRANTEMARILGHIMSRIYTLPKDGQKSSSVSRSAIVELKQELSAWKTRLPSRLRHQKPDPKSQFFRAEVHLHLGYYQAIILITRPFLLHLVRTRGPTKQAAPSAAPDQNAALIEQLALNCVDAAHEGIKLIQNLQKHNKICRFDFWDYHYCCACAYVILLRNVIHGDDPRDPKAIQCAMDVMEYIASGNDSAKLALDLMRELHVIVRKRRSGAKGKATKDEVQGWSVAPALVPASGSFDPSLVPLGSISEFSGSSISPVPINDLETFVHEDILPYQDNAYDSNNFFRVFGIENVSFPELGGEFGFGGQDGGTFDWGI
ncbi:hypothetical protein SAICODRAFT_32185 [Saitoella complicata NRRL Y-17804]|uniref:Zn(2)-C6 fungal-type domain-containing protein n=1 Tax=Saitoella complicata (strain BCRC 22490 / CBS 7301 / JCM 7358 / NBRC 10748 / NRRL Y-17804) TaxID=698492 RepID=A0A0E9ND34_SAICN|nr:uncharacterized protein SAICODRAFT_32185 [Saitoella complicata NRRL Y-17804]ODQ49827.1 hypothetical protein SAICODRAFT_32185 [Saitoella complicata NRRL Y-17804]GAO47749.1 hypothetical protein G7K_1948-t1 [Saitoella complicata NRRL Y-17804]